MEGGDPIEAFKQRPKKGGSKRRTMEEKPTNHQKKVKDALKEGDRQGNLGGGV